jgi:hypothetical protein
VGLLKKVKERHSVFVKVIKVRCKDSKNCVCFLMQCCRNQQRKGEKPAQQFHGIKSSFTEKELMIQGLKGSNSGYLISFVFGFGWQHSKTNRRLIRLIQCDSRKMACFGPNSKYFSGIQSQRN